MGPVDDPSSPVASLGSWALAGQATPCCDPPGRDAASTDQTPVSGLNLGSDGAGGSRWVSSRKGAGPIEELVGFGRGGAVFLAPMLN